MDVADLVDAAVTRPSLRHRIVEGFYERRFALQFALLALVLVADPLLEAIGVAGSVLDRGIAICVAVSLIGFERGKPPLARAAITALALAVLGVAVIGHRLVPQLAGVWLVAGAFVVVATVRRALRAGHADRERVFAALDGYLLTGMLFGATYWLLSQHSSEAFAGDSFKSHLDAIYFSFGTLATLGYAGIAPHSSAARGLTVVEAVGGQLYLAVLLARLVSLYGPRR